MTPDIYAFMLQASISLVAIGAFYGAVKAELWWIKKALESHSNLLEKLDNKIRG